MGTFLGDGKILQDFLTKTHLHVHCRFISCSLSVQLCSLHICLMFIICLFYVHFVLILCLFHIIFWLCFVIFCSFFHLKRYISSLTAHFCSFCILIHFAFILHFLLPILYYFFLRNSNSNCELRVRWWWFSRIYSEFSFQINLHCNQSSIILWIRSLKIKLSFGKFNFVYFPIKSHT